MAHALIAALLLSASESRFSPLFLECARTGQPLPVAECRPTPLVEHGDRSHPRIALTFDACSSGQFNWDEAVYQTLEHLNVRATIFLGGEWVERQRAMARRIANNALLEVATHGYHHHHLTTLGKPELERELRDGQRAIYRELGLWPTLFRAPFGEIDAEVLGAADRLGLKVVQYDLPSGDPDPLISADKIVRWVSNGVRNGSIVVFHINKNGVHTAQTLPAVITELRRRGFELVTVSELLGQEPTFTDGAACLDPLEPSVVGAPVHTAGPLQRVAARALPPAGPKVTFAPNLLPPK